MGRSKVLRMNMIVNNIPICFFLEYLSQPSLPLSKHEDTTPTLSDTPDWSKFPWKLGIRIQPLYYPWEVMKTGLLDTIYKSQGRRTKGWFQIWKRVCQVCILSPCIFNLNAEYIMWNAGLDESQAGIKIARRNINNLRYPDNTTLMAESKEELRASWWKWKWRVKKLA